MAATAGKIRRRHLRVRKVMKRTSVIEVSEGAKESSGKTLKLNIGGGDGGVWLFLRLKCTDLLGLVFFLRVCEGGRWRDKGRTCGFILLVL